MKPREVSWNDISVLMGKTVDIMVCEKVKALVDEKCC